MSGSPASLRSGLNEPVARLRKSRGLPVIVEKTRLLSCQRLPALSRSPQKLNNCFTFAKESPVLGL